MSNQAEAVRASAKQQEKAHRKCKQDRTPPWTKSTITGREHVLGLFIELIWSQIVGLDGVHPNFSAELGRLCQQSELERSPGPCASIPNETRNQGASLTGIGSSLHNGTSVRENGKTVTVELHAHKIGVACDFADSAELLRQEKKVRRSPIMG